MKKRTKIIILSVMVLLLGVTGYLNVVLNNSINNEATPTTTTTASYFTSYREDRESSRGREISYYQAIINSEKDSSLDLSKAKEDMLSLIAQIEKELIVENLIKGLGYDDCLITITDSNINVVIKSGTLTDPETAKIMTILQEQLSADYENVKIMSIG